MSNAPLPTRESELDSVTEGIDALQLDAKGETSPCTQRTKLSARDLLATLSEKRISISEIVFFGEGSRDGGAYGDVVVATIVKTGGSEEKGRRVAVKKLRFVINGDMTEEKFLRIFVNELRVLDKLSHPNIVEIIGFVEDVENRIAWLVFPWEENGNLREFLRSGEWEIPERVSLILDVATGLEYLHTSQPPICHGDLKSLNILVNSSNRAVITDFGSARVIRRTQEASASPTTQTAASSSHRPIENKDLPQLKITTSDTALTLTGPACSLRWSPPEVLTGESLDMATDIWALGWVAWEAITDCYPFEEAQGELGITMKIIEGRLPLIRDHMQLSQIGSLCSVMHECWKLEPKQRPSITGCRQALESMPWSIPVVKSGDEVNVRSAALLLQVGILRRLQKRYEEASKAYNQGLSMARLAGDQATEARILVELGDNGQERSKYVEAEAAYTKALAICESIGFDWCRANALLGLGSVQAARSKYVEAEASYTQALAISESIGNDLVGARALVGLGNVQQAQSKYVEADALYSRVLAICGSMGYDWCRGNAFFGLGDVQREQSKYVEAAASYTQALAIYESIGEDLGRANCWLRLAQIRFSQARYAEAKTLINDASMISEQFGYGWGKTTSKKLLDEVVEGEKSSSELRFPS